MSATKILWGQIAVVFLIVLLTTWAATQYVAWSLGFQAQLGAPWFVLLGVPIYYPPAFFWWWYFYDAYAPEVFAKGGMIAASGGFIAVAVAIGMSVWRAREAKNAATYGSARWAEKEEVKSAGLLNPDGVVLGRYDRDYLRHDGPEHVLCFAPTRSGKGVGLVVPSLLTWPGSAIVHDIKGENWQLTAGFRARHGRVLLFDPTNPKSSAYNPLLEVRRGEWEVRDVQTARQLLTPGEIMQLPPTDEIVMVAGTPPIRAKKARYYEDVRFKERILPPPELARPAEGRPDDWSRLRIPARPDTSDSADPTVISDEEEDSTESERRHQPELSRVKPVEKMAPIDNEFEFGLPDDTEDDAARNQRLTRAMGGVARQVSLDPNDGMEL